MINRIFQLENPQFFENMVPFLCQVESFVSINILQKRNLNILLEYLIKDFIPARSTSEDYSKFTDSRCEKINVFQVDRRVSLVLSYVERWELEEFIERNKGLYHLYFISRLSNQQHERGCQHLRA